MSESAQVGDVLPGGAVRSPPSGTAAPWAGRAPASVFAADEAQALAPLPARPFVLAIWSTAKVGPDIHIKAGATLYSVPWRHIGRRVDVRSTATVVQVFDAGQLIAIHPHAPRGKQTDPGHYPPEKIAFQMKTPRWCRHKAAEIGPATTAAIEDLLAVNALYRLRSAQGVLALEAKHGPDRLEKACARAVAVGDPSYRTIKGILIARVEQAPLDILDHHDDPPAAPTGTWAHLHGPEALFAIPDPDEPPHPDSATPSTARDPHDHHEPAAHDGPGQHERPPKADTATPSTARDPHDHHEPAAHDGPSHHEPAAPATEPAARADQSAARYGQAS